MSKKLSSQEIKKLGLLTENLFDDTYGQHHLYKFGTEHNPVNTESTKAVASGENVKDKFFEMIKTACELIDIGENSDKAKPTCDSCGGEPKYNVELSNNSEGKEDASKFHDLCNDCYGKKLDSGYHMSGQIKKYRFR